jgi:hypothetical protein
MFEDIVMGSILLGFLGVGINFAYRLWKTRGHVPPDPGRLILLVVLLAVCVVGVFQRVQAVLENL